MGWFDFLRRKSSPGGSPLYFYNTLTGQKDPFSLYPHAKEVRMYNCGPTVYGRQHIGNLSMFVFTDVLRRTLEYNRYPVKQVINFTDFGHLSSDADEGEDKMTKGLKSEGLAPTLENMRALGEKYGNIFLEDIRALNVDVDHITFPRASDYVPAQIAMIETLEQKGYAYRAKDGVYFDTSRFPEYGKLGNIKLEGQQAGARVKAAKDKRNPTDFLLWKSDKKLGWDSPWGKGFPGWHIECSAMIRKTLGEQIDIHTGGVEHIPIHHNNEIAQSECATGKRPLSRFWLHRAHVQLEGTKLAKSTGNVVYLSDIIERGFEPMALRYLLLSSHYRTSSNFTWQALEAAQTAYKRLAQTRVELSESSPAVADKRFVREFTARINDDLDTPGALALLWEWLKDDAVLPAQKLGAILEADKIFALRLTDQDGLQTFVPKDMTPQEAGIEIASLVGEREQARMAKDFERADALRREIRDKGFDVRDTADGPRLTHF